MAADSTGFWVIAGLLALGVTVLLLWSLLAARKGDLTPELSHDIGLYREQLATLERDREAGRVAPDEAARLRAEIARRLLDADRRQASAARPQSGATFGVIVAVILVLGAGLGSIYIYRAIGANGLADLPLTKRLADSEAAMKGRPTQAEYVASLPPKAPVSPDATFADLMEKLRKVVDPATSDDREGLTLLARNEALLNNFDTALTAQRRLIAIKGTEVLPEDHLFLAEMLIRQADIYVSPEAEAALAATLQIDPRNGAARYYLGLMFVQGARFDRAFALWQPLLEGAPDAPWSTILREQIGEVAALAGVKYTPPPVKGPSAADVAAAADMSPENRTAMIEGMVETLGARLSSQGGPAPDWAQFIRALRVLGRDDQAQQVHAEALTIFEDAASRAELDAALTAEVRP